MPIKMPMYYLTALAYLLTIPHYHISEDLFDLQDNLGESSKLWGQLQRKPEGARRL